MPLDVSAIESVLSSLYIEDFMELKAIIGITGELQMYYSAKHVLDEFEMRIHDNDYNDICELCDTTLVAFNCKQAECVDNAIEKFTALHDGFSELALSYYNGMNCAIDSLYDICSDDEGTDRMLVIEEGIKFVKVRIEELETIVRSTEYKKHQFEIEQLKLKLA